MQPIRAIPAPAAGRKRTPPRGFADTRGQDEGDEGARAEQAVPGFQQGKIGAHNWKAF